VSPSRLPRLTRRQGRTPKGASRSSALCRPAASMAGTANPSEPPVSGRCRPWLARVAGGERDASRHRWRAPRGPAATPRRRSGSRLPPRACGRRRGDLPRRAGNRIAGAVTSSMPSGPVDLRFRFQGTPLFSGVSQVCNLLFVARETGSAGRRDPNRSGRVTRRGNMNQAPTVVVEWVFLLGHRSPPLLNRKIELG
jgi:hypothetical protein